MGRGEGIQNSKGPAKLGLPAVSILLMSSTIQATQKGGGRGEGMRGVVHHGWCGVLSPEQRVEVQGQGGGGGAAMGLC